MTNPTSATLSIESMTCASCVGRVDRALGSLEGVDDVSVNLANETARVSVDAPERLREIAGKLDEAGYPARRASVTLNVASMTCASCVGRVDKALAAVSGVLDVNVNLASETATVSYLEGATDAAALANAATQAGYPAEIAEADASLDRAAHKEEEAREIARRTILAASLALPVFLLEMGAHLVPGMHEWIGRTIGHQTSWLIQFALTTAVLLGPGRFSISRAFLRF